MTVSKREGEVISSEKITRGLTFLNRFPQKRFFQLFVDGDTHIIENGQNGFEKREPHCISCFYDGFIHAIRNINQPLSVDLLLAFHEAATRGVGGEFKGVMLGEFRQCPMKPIIFYKDMCTVEGIKEQMKIGESYDDVERRNILGDAIMVHLPNSHQQVNLLAFHFFSRRNKAQAIYEYSNQNPISFIPPANTTLLTETAQNIINDYLTQIQEAQNTDAKLLAIARCAKRMLLLHPFEDGNLRTCVNIMLNFLLIQQGYPPCIFYNPNVFYLFATEELVDVVKMGIVDSLFVSDNPDMPLFGYRVCDEKYMAESEKMKLVIEMSQMPIQEQKLELVKQYFQSSMDPIIKILHLAATQGCLKTPDETQVIDIANIKGPENTTTLFNGKTLLHIAFLTNQKELFDFLLETNPHLINEKDLVNKTLLHYAMEHGQSNFVVELLKNYYLDLEVGPLNYLNFAVANGDLDTAKLLLEHGAMVTEGSYKAISDKGIDKAKFHDLLDAYRVGSGLSHRG